MRSSGSPGSPAAAGSFLALGLDRDAVEALSRSLDRHWESSLLALYAECRPEDATRQLEQAERWLKEHPQDAPLLRALGALCERAQLWGKAQTYFEASLSVEPSHRAHLALGELFRKLGRDGDANAHLAAALKLAVSDLKDAGG